MKKLFLKIGNIFKGLFSAAQRTWNKLSPEVKAAFVWGSGLIAEINNAIDGLPADILKNMQLKYPELPIDKMVETLRAIALNLGLINEEFDGTPESLIAIFQEYLGKLNGTFWASVSRDLAVIATVLFAPTPMKVEAVASLIGYVYHAIVKK